MPIHRLGIRLVQVLFLVAVAATSFGYGGLGAVVAVCTIPLVVVTGVLWYLFNRRMEREDREAGRR